MKNPKTPERAEPLCAVLTPEQFKAVCAIARTTPEPELTAKLKEYCRSIGEHLEAHGVFPDYLAYWLYAKFTGVI